ncbi:MAG: DegQ family serine endoprotease [Alphaproteobacteria bacterium]|nr:DegQ family serine endoprotease [Alphaproteobacteria bacterium]
MLPLGMAAAFLLAPALAEAQGAAPATGGNITQQVQNETAIALPSLAPLVHRVLPAVVNVSAELNQQAAARPDEDAGDGDNGMAGSPFDEMLRRFFENRLHPQGPGRQQVMALGSGFIIDPHGYVVTNNHVVGEAEKVTVILQDNSRHPAKIIGRDEKTDLALLKIDAGDHLPFVTWGSSGDAKVGDWVVAVGNPFGLGGTVTAGIISALGRNINEGPYDDFLQIDAPINRGNSGGPTFNLSGQVIGINTAIYSPSGGSVGIGFAIPSDIARDVIAQLAEHGHVTRGWLGVAVQTITPTIARTLGLDPDAPEGALVSSVTPDSPAAAIGLQPGDIILSANGQPIHSVRDLPRLVAAAPIGQKLALTVRRNGRDMTLAPVIAQLREAQQQAAANPEQGGGGALGSFTSFGMDLAGLDAAARARFHIPREVSGVVVSQVAGDSPAAALGIQPGDVIVSVDQKPVNSPQEAADRLKEAATHGNILLLLNRHGSSEFVGLSVGGPGNPG